MNEMNIIRKALEFKALRTEAHEAIAAYEDDADFDFTISRLAAIGEKMTILTDVVAHNLGRRIT